MFLIVTGTVTGLPAASVVLALSGSPAALALTLLNTTLPVYGSEISFPAVGSVNATISVQVPGTGLRVYALSDSVWVPLTLFCPIAERVAVRADQVVAPPGRSRRWRATRWR